MNHIPCCSLETQCPDPPVRVGRGEEVPHIRDIDLSETAMHSPAPPPGSRFDQLGPADDRTDRTKSSRRPTGLTRERIWHAAQELASVGRCFTRQRLAQLCGLAFSIIDDHVDRLIEDGMIRRIRHGVFEVVPQFESDGPISLTVLDDTRVKLEVGDVVLTLSPAGARTAAKMLAGWATELATLDSHAEIVAIVNHSDARSRRNERRVDAIERLPKTAAKRAQATVATA
jgi:hypothetical protein